MRLLKLGQLNRVPCLSRFSFVNAQKSPSSSFATVGAVNTDKPRQEDSMESFVLAESLKYYYLLVSRS